MNVNISGQLIDIDNEEARGNCYRLLAACFYYPQKDVFIEEGLFKNLTELFRKVCPSASVFSEEMEKAISNYSNEDLLVDYSRLFVGPSELIAPPYGSVYLDEGRRVMGDSTMEVIKMYEEEGLSKDSEFKDLPDHIAVELEFMYYLTFKEVEALRQSDLEKAKGFIDKQEIFLNTFLQRWVPPFCEKIRDGTDNKFYIALSDCLSTFVMNSAIPHDIYKHLTERPQGVMN